MRTRRRPSSPPHPRHFGTSALHVATIVAALSLAGCSDLPDWANPADWYKRAQSSFTSDVKPQPTPKTTEAEAAKERIDNAPIPGEGEPFPNLASVPPRPPASTPGERKDIQQALISDREHAHYIEEGKGPRSEPAPDSDIAAAPHAPVTLAGPIPPPPAAAEPTPAPKGASQLAQSRAPAAAPKAAEPPAVAAPPPAPEPAPTPAPPPQASATAGAPRALGRLVIGPTGEVKQARPGDGGALPNTAVPPPSSNGLAQGGMSLEPTAIVLFNVNATKLSAQQTNGLKAVADAAKQAGAVRIVGHASPARNANSTASVVNNFQVAWARAKAVADALTKLGVAPERLHVEADTSPAATVPEADLPKGDAGLRRADIFLQ
ncbi:MAG TPA: OmpA family protein [Alphaproteobacteria bacterium]|nr:OmpA family protein [Alphaproteobacteria bacterium]